MLFDSRFSDVMNSAINFRQLYRTWWVTNKVCKERYNNTMQIFSVFKSHFHIIFNWRQWMKNGLRDHRFDSSPLKVVDLLFIFETKFEKYGILLVSSPLPIILGLIWIDPIEFYLQIFLWTAVLANWARIVSTSWKIRWDFAKSWDWLRTMSKRFIRWTF